MSRFNTEVFLTLTEANKEKVEHIYFIAANLKILKLQPLSVKDFDRLYDMSLTQLRRLSGLPIGYCTI